VETFASAGKKYPVAQAKPVEELEDSVKPIDQTGLREVLLQHLQPGETVPAALRRLGKDKKPGKSKKKPSASDTKDPFDIVTETADQLLSAGYYDVYTDKREQMESSMNRGTKSSVAAKPAKPQEAEQPKVMWEYKTDKVYGPYSNSDMLAWKEQGYFAEDLLVRKINTEDIYSDDGEFVSCATVDFSKYS